MKFAVKAAADGTTVDVDIYDIVGNPWTYPPCTAKGVRDVLKYAGSAEQINVRISSKGGEVFEGLGIYQLLVDHPARVVVTIDGIAASIASIIAMAGDEIRIAANGFVMIHNAEGGARGGAEDMKALGELLEKVNARMVATYTARTGQKPEDVAKWMADETWMTADEAKARGFVTTVLEAKQGSTKKTALAAFAQLDDLGDFLNVPEELRGFVLAARADDDPPAPPVVDPKVTPPPRAAPTAQEERRAFSMKLSPEILALLGLAQDADQAAVEAAIKAKCSTPVTASAEVMRSLGARTESEGVRISAEYGRTAAELLGLTRSSTLEAAMAVVSGWQASDGRLVALRAENLKLIEDARLSALDSMIAKYSHDETVNGVVTRKAKLPPGAAAWARASFKDANAFEQWALTMPLDFATSKEVREKESETVALTDLEIQAAKSVGVPIEQLLETKKLEAKQARERAAGGN